MTTSVAIVNWNSGKLLRRCVESVLATTSRSEIVVVDNASSDDSVELLEELRERIHLIRNSLNRGLAAATNQAASVTESSYLLTLNPDIRVVPGAIQQLEVFLDDHPRAGAVGGFVNEKYLPRPFPTPLTFIREDLGLQRRCPVLPAQTSFAVDQPAAAALMIRRDAFDEIGGWDEQFYPCWYEDVDFCKRLHAAGWEIHFLPGAHFEHDGGYSAAALGKRAFAQAYYHNQLRYARKHFGALASLAVRGSMAAGMVARMAVEPRNANAYAGVLRGALGGW